MYNPFPLLTPGLLRDQVAKGKRYFVRQNFPRGYTRPLKAAFLLRAYEAIDQVTAEQHLAALAHRSVSEGGAPDPYAFLYDVTIQDHLVRLKTAATQPFGYKDLLRREKGRRLEASRDLSRKDAALYQPKPSRLARHTRKTTASRLASIEEFGELFLKFSCEAEHDTIPFDLIETY